MLRAADEVSRRDHYPRWQNEKNVVDIWLNTHNDSIEITELDRELANVLDQLASAKKLDDSAITDDQKTIIITEMQLYADGGSRGNPGPSASGYALLNMSDEVVLQSGEYIGITTNNQAEYRALKLGMEHALQDFQAHEIHVYMDSMLVVNQMKNIFKIKNRDLWPIHNACVDLAKKFRKITFDHVPRELNKVADREVNKALDDALKHKDEPR